MCLPMSSSSPSPSPEERPATLAFRDKDALYALCRAFEENWADWQDASMQAPSRPGHFPPAFASRWALAWWMKGATDDEVSALMRTWERHPADVERDGSQPP